MDTLASIEKISNNGQVVIGNYTFHEKNDFLGEGAFGKVYKAKNSSSNELAAIKIMSLSLIQDPSLRESLKTEIQVMKMVKSENCVHIYEVFQDVNDNELYIILEFCEDGDLRHLLNKQHRLQEKFATNVLGQLLEGFKELVSLGYIHRDIKPENALCKKSVYKVADFGFATKVDITGQEYLYDAVGTPIYMAPQLLSNYPYTAKSDIWSIGIMLYEFVCGNRPWMGRDIESYLEEIELQPLRFPYDLDLSEEMKDLIRRCLEFEEDQRIGWDQIFTHQLIKDWKDDQQKLSDQKQQQEQPKPKEAQKHAFEQQQKSSIDSKQISYLDKFNFDKEELQILQTLIEQFGHIKIDPEEYIKEQNLDQIDQQQFYKLLSSLKPNILKVQSFRIFKKIDQDQDGKIQIQELKKIFCELDFCDRNDSFDRLLKEFLKILEKRNYNLQEVFQKIDQSQSGFSMIFLYIQGSLDFTEFFSFLKLMAPKFPEYDAKTLFKYFDQGGDKKILFSEFEQMINKRQESIQANQQFQLLKKKIKAKHSNLNELFSVLDQDSDHQLNYGEFSQQSLLKEIDAQINEKNALLMFKFFDVDKSNSVSKSEFLNQLKN